MRNPAVIILVVAGIALLWGIFKSIDRGKTVAPLIGLLAGGGGLVLLGWAISAFQSARRSAGSGALDGYAAALFMLIGVPLLLIGLIAVAMGATGDAGKEDWPWRH